MSKITRNTSRRIMAVALSAAMVMSNLTVTASEATESIVETVVEAEETVASSEVVIEDEEVPTTLSVGEEVSSEEDEKEELFTESVTTQEPSITEETSSVEETSTTEELSEATEEKATEEVTSQEATTEEETITEEETTTEEERIALMSLRTVVEADLYVAPNGNGDGLSANSPMDFVNALSELQPGYTIKMAPGTYHFSKTILIEESNAGTAAARKSVVADGGDVILDFSGMGYTGSDADKSNRGIVLDGSYWKFYGITIKEAADNGMLLSGDNNIIEMCVFEGNHDSGLQISRYQTNYNTIAQWPSNNLIKNCTSFNNVDSEGENADGFAAKLTCGEGNVFDGCMAYNNSDDGWDLYAKTTTGPIGVVTLQNCIAFRNGKLTTGEGSAQGDMNGFKLGGSGVGTPHKLVNCIAFENGAHGFTDNNNPTAVSLTNCTSFNNSRYASKKSNFQMNRENGGVNSNLLSFTTDSMGSDAFIGTINNSVYYNNKPAYYSVVDQTSIAKGDKLGEIVTVTSSDFVNVTAPGTSTDFHTEWRDESGNVDTKGFLMVAANSQYATMASDGKALGARLSGDEYMVVVPDAGQDDKNEGKDPTVGTIGGTDTSLNASDLIVGDVMESVTIGDFILNANSSKKITVDANAKSVDGFDFTQRIKLGGTGKTEYRNVQYTATDAATMTVYAMSSSSSEDRALVLVDQDGKTVASQIALGTSISKLTFEIPVAGTYYLYSSDSGINLYYIAVDYPEVKVDDPKPVEFVLDTTTDITAFAAGAKVDGDSQKAGTEDYFTLIYSAKTKVDGSERTFEDGYAATQRVNFGGGVATNKNAIKFTTSHAASVKVWWVEGGDDNRQLTILDASGNTVATTAVTVAKNEAVISAFELPEAGTYYLGSTPKNNYIFKVAVTEEVSAEPIVSTLDTTTDITAFAAGAKADGDSEKAGTNEYFTLIYSAKTKVDGSERTFEDGYAATQRVNFGGGVATNKNAIKFTTSHAASVKVWWVEGGDDNRQLTILDASGNTVATTTVTAAKNEAVISAFELPEAGTYYLGSTPKNNYIFKVEVTETAGGVVKPERSDWATVAVPEITNIALNAEDANKVDVTVKANIGYDGADKITVTMTDANGVEVGNVNSMKEGEEVTVNFTPSASGTYIFAVKAIRDGEEDKMGAGTKQFTFSLPLTVPVIKSATSMGNGTVEVEWESVKEAVNYIVTVEGTEIKMETEELVALVEDLDIGKEYTFKVVAVRGEAVSEAGSITAVVTEDAQTKWAFSAYGSGVNLTDNGYEGNANDGSVRVFSKNGRGKIVPNTTDGLAFYYTKIDPKTTNFTLTATARVNNWVLSNGQEGFGLMAADAVGKSGDSSTFWNNSYMASVTKVEYYWDGEKVSDSGSKISMKLGVGSQEKIGVKAEDITEALTLKDMSVFSSHMTTLETSCADKGAGTYNIVGGYTGTEPTGTVDDITEFTLTIQKNNTGYFVSYTDEAGNTTINKYYGTDVLNDVDKDSVYVGFYASRNADITFTDIVFTTIAPEEDAPAEERPVTKVTASYAIESATVANQAAHDLVFRGNADGTLVIKDSKGNELKNSDEVKANEKVIVPVMLELGNNKYTVTFTPNPDYKPSETEVLDSYETVTFEHSVLFRQYGEAGDSLYVSPNGSAAGNGTKANPLDIYTAVKYVQAGQTIVITEGTYNLTKTVKVERGINGTADSMIYMVADPEAASRPVFDFGGKCAGMVLAGDYWYFKGFDVTRSADAQKGIQVSGDYNTLDQINTYKNGNTGIQISRYLGTDKFEDWPSYNTILNCTSYLNADKGYEDADGFAAKLTIGNGNVFDGCIAHHNADDGWDLFAKLETGPIGKVVIKNSIAYKNGYVLRNNNGAGDLDLDGVEVNAGNGNGFKMGGESITGQHELHNSIAFFNKAKGIDSNSGPDIKVYNSIAFNNQSHNVALYTNSAINTDYEATGIVSYRTDYKGMVENIRPKGSQDQTKVYGASNFYWDVTTQKSVNTEGVTVSDDWFESLEFTGVSRNADGTINMNGFLVLTDKAVAGEAIGGTGSGDVIIGEETDGKVETGVVSGTGTGSGSSSSSSDNSSSSTATKVNKTTVTIEEVVTPLAVTPTLPAGYTYEQVNISKSGMLRAELLHKYYGQKSYFAAIVNKNVGITFDMQNVSAVATDMNLTSTMIPMKDFAKGFHTVRVVVSERTKLPTSATLHYHVGSENVGKIAYIYALAEDAASYKLVTAMTVNEIGNVAIETTDFTDVMILVAE